MCFDLEASFVARGQISIAAPCSKHWCADVLVLWGSEGLGACVPQCSQSKYLRCCRCEVGCLVRLHKLLFVELVVLPTFPPTCC